MVRQGNIGMLGVFIGALVISTITPLAIVLTGAWQTGLTSNALTAEAFGRVLGRFGGWVVASGSITFDYSTLPAWVVLRSQVHRLHPGRQSLPAIPLGLVHRDRGRGHLLAERRGHHGLLEHRGYAEPGDGDPESDRPPRDELPAVPGNPSVPAAPCTRSRVTRTVEAKTRPFKPAAPSASGTTLRLGARGVLTPGAGGCLPIALPAEPAAQHPAR